MPKYRKKPIALEAREITSTQATAVAEWCAGRYVPEQRWDGGRISAHIIVPSPEGDHRADIGDWVIQGTRGEFWAVRGDIFAETYEAAE